jgi:putative ABC transport system permease protein
MMDSLYIAWQYVSWNRGKTMVLITSITLIAFLPLALQSVLNESEQQLRSRAVDTPLLVGAKGSALDLVMSSLYFDDEVPEVINMQRNLRVLGMVYLPIFCWKHCLGKQMERQLMIR